MNWIISHFVGPFLGFLFILNFPIFIILSVVFISYRKAIAVIAKIVRPDLGEIVPERSVVFGQDEIYSRPKCNIVVTAVFEGDIDINLGRRISEERVLESRLSSTGELRYPEMRQNVVQWCGLLFWKPCEKFSVEESVQFAEESVKCEDNDNKIMGEAALTEMRQKMLEKPWTKSGPLGEFIVVKNYFPEKNCLIKHTAILGNFHHVMGDGLSTLHLCIVQLLQQSPSKSLTVSPNYPKFTFLQKLKYALVFPFKFAHEIGVFYSFRWSHRMDYFGLEKKYQSGKIHTGTMKDRIPLEVVKEIKNKFGVCFTSVLFAVVAGAIRELLLERGEDIKEGESLPSLVPIPVPRNLERLRNDLTGGWTMLPIGEGDPLIRLEKCERDFAERLKKSAFPVAMLFLGKFIGAFPPKMVKMMTRNDFVSVGISNIPGATEWADFEGRRMVDGSFCTGLQNGSTGSNFESNIKDEMYGGNM
jgi:hypothetical protein